MKSSLKIALGQKRFPIIEFLVSKDSDDLKDDMCREFIRELQNSSNFCLIETDGAYIHNDNDRLVRWNIKPVGSLEDLRELKERLDETIRVIENKDKIQDTSGRIPRRNRLDLMHSSEKIIVDAVQEIEKLPADVRLTDAINYLHKAKDKVSDFIDDIKPQ